MRKSILKNVLASIAAILVGAVFVLFMSTGCGDMDDPRGVSDTDTDTDTDTDVDTDKDLKNMWECLICGD